MDGHLAQAGGLHLAAEIGIVGVSTWAGNAAWAIAAGATTAAVCVVYGCNLPRKSLNQGCTIHGAGWTAYVGLDAQHGDRSQGVVACLTEDYIDTHPGSPTTTDVRPPGYAWAQRYIRHIGGTPRRELNNCHLLGAQLSGSGTDLRNLAACGRDANAFPAKGGLGAMSNMAQFENQVRDLVGRQGVVSVSYRVRPVYVGNRVVPEGFAMAAVVSTANGGSWKLGRYIPNLANTPGGWTNLGTVVDSRTGKDVPVQ